MKNNTFKRVMAGTLAVLTVASPMTANVGGFLTGSVAIVASADEVAAPSTAKYNVTWTNAAKYLTKYTEDYVDTALTDVNIETGLENMSTLTATQGSTLTFNSKVPLDFKTQGTYLNTGYVKYVKDGVTGYAKPVEIGNEEGKVALTDVVDKTVFGVGSEYVHEVVPNNSYSTDNFAVEGLKTADELTDIFYERNRGEDIVLLSQWAYDGAAEDGNYVKNVFESPWNMQENKPAPLELADEWYYTDGEEIKQVGDTGSKSYDELKKPVAIVNIYAEKTDEQAKYTAGTYDEVEAADVTGIESLWIDGKVDADATDFVKQFSKDIYKGTNNGTSIDYVKVKNAGEDFVNLADDGQYYTKTTPTGSDTDSYAVITDFENVAQYAIAEGKTIYPASGGAYDAEAKLNKEQMEAAKKDGRVNATADKALMDVLRQNLYQERSDLFGVDFDGPVFRYNTTPATATDKAILNHYELNNNYFCYTGNLTGTTDRTRELATYATDSKKTAVPGTDLEKIYEKVAADVATRDTDEIGTVTVEKAADVEAALKDAANAGKVIEVKNADNTYTYTYKMGNEPILIEPVKQTATITKKDKTYVESGVGESANVVSGVTVTDGSNNTAVGENGEFVVNDTVKVTAPVQFIVKVDDNNPQKEYISPTTYFENDQFVAEFTMPKNVAEDEKNVQIDVYPVKATYTYTTAGNKILATGGAVTNATIAALNVTSISKTPSVGDEAVEVTEGKEVANNQAVTVKFDAAKAENQLFKNDVKVTKKYNSESTAVDITEEAKTGVQYTEPGSYEITMTATGNDGRQYSITRKFTIAAKSALKAENVKLDFSKVAKAEDPSQTQNNATDATLGSAYGKTGEATVLKLTKEQTEYFAEHPYEFKPVITFDGIKKDDNTALTYKTDYEITGYVSGSTLDKTYTFTVKIYNSEFGGSASNPKTFDVSWKVSSYEADAEFISVPDNNAISVAKEDVEDLSDKIFNASAANSVAKANQSKVTYQYVEGVGAGVQEDELDEKIAGLPSAPGKYTVYLYYNEELKASIAVNITQYSLYLEAAAKELAITYGDTFKTENYTLVDADGKAITAVTASDIKYTINKAVFVQKNGKDTTELAKNEDGSYKTGDSVAANDKEEDLATLNAGTYIVEFSATSSDAENYTIGSKQQVLTVAKKAITADMITIDPIQYDGNTHDIMKDGTANAYDPATKKKLKVKINEGTQEKAIGAYKATVALDTVAVDEASEFDNANYTGTAQVAWHIVYPNETGTYQTGLKWDDSRTTLYDNGNIHVELNRNANDKIINIDTKAKVAVQKYGVIIEKDGKLAAPAAYGVDYSTAAIDAMTDADAKEKALAEKTRAERELQLGNGYATGGYTETTEFKASENQTYKANIKVKDAQTGIWARPYILLETGDVVYGDVKFIRLEEEAKTRLNLVMPFDKQKNVNSTAIRRADLEATAKPGDIRIKGGYDPDLNKYYAYANFTDLETAGFTNVLEVADFGVVLDKTGKIAADAAPQDVKETLVLKKGFIEGHYNKKNTVLKTNEYAASITPKDSVTGVWVRPYLDLGNGLIVYGDPQYFNSASEYYKSSNNTAELVINTRVTPETGKIKLTVNQPTNPTVANANNGKINETVASDKVKVVKAGVVVDKKSVIDLIDVSKLTGTDLDKANEKNEATLKSELIIRGDLIKGTKSTGLDVANWHYDAQLTPVEQNVYVRSYVIYDIDGVQVTVYGDVKTIAYNSATKTYTEVTKSLN